MATLFNPSTWFKASKREAEKNLLNAVVRQWIGFGGTVADMRQDKEGYVQDAYMINSLVYQAVNYIASKAGRVPVRAAIEKPDGTIEYLPNAHPLNQLLRRPNKWQGAAEFNEQALGYKLITGNSYIYLIKPAFGASKGQVVEMHIMPAHLTEIKVKAESQWIDPIEGYVIKYAPNITFPAENVVHIRYPNYDYDLGDWYGQSPLKALAKVVDRSNANYDAAKAAFNNLGAAGIITVETIEEGMGLSAEQAAQLESRYQTKFGSPDKKGKVLVTAGKLKWQQIALSPVDLNMVADDELTMRRICSAYNLPSVLFNDTEGRSYNNMAEARKAAWTDAIQPLLDSYCEELTRQVAAPFGKNVVVVADYSGVSELQKDLSTVVDALSKASWMTHTEKRKHMNLPPDPMMDKYFIPNNLVPYEELPPLGND